MAYKKTIGQNVNDFFKLTIVKGELGSNFIPSEKIINELTKFFVCYKNKYSGKNFSDSQMKWLSKFISDDITDYYIKFEEAKKLKIFSLKYFEFHYGKELGSKKYLERKASTSKWLSYSNFKPEKKVEIFLNRKGTQSLLSGVIVSAEQIVELKKLVETNAWPLIDDEKLIVDFIKFNQTNFVYNYFLCKKIPYSSFDHKMIRFNGNLQHISLLSKMKSNRAKLNFSNNIDYWINKGFSNSDSISKISEVQKNRSLKSPSSKKGSTYSPRCLEYWIKQGLSETESKNTISELQKRDLNWFILKYGDDNGPLKYKNMLEKRAETWFNRSDEDRYNINQTKGRTFDQLCETFGEEKASNIIVSRTSNSGGISKESIYFFSLLDESLGDIAKNSVTGYKGKERWFKTVDHIYFVDYFLNGKIVEYNGSFWHADPKLFKKDEIHSIFNVPCSEIWENDKTREDMLTKLGYKCIIVWSQDVKQNLLQEIERVRAFLLN
jgi:hypothetical protein